ncbi:AAA family ATPase [Pseudomonas aeruginosa]|uniref:AAA family ATPase n=1 Tax=Pseudomonas aeruginosa TaxID=287 RepID=UPI0008FB24F9|nr:ATP-binding protein [Pseudomonas aeruginosa]EIU3182695.1 AAA family ATPase [Pseudomonas aeruginosa]EIU3225964.1 AAA family ATPase [Pseudomonas aeruginosa]EIU3239549.1 AAA family ATPase [Pseudomonas aeruginosa]EKU7530692.1 AAA family ATPase [Pseudomonas aeruginosa]EKV3043666.1 AAA family ATPase [Pseudomonas aeruginosa]
MYITEIEITDLRSFRGAHSVSLAHSDGTYPGWTVFAGRNGAGKSTLLKAIALSVIGPLASRSLAGVFTDWVRKGAESGMVASRIAFTEQKDTFQSGGRVTKTPFWAGLKWSPSSHGHDVLERWMDKESPNRQRIPDRGPWADGPSGWFIAGYGPYRHLGPPPADVIKLSGDPVVARLVNLFNETATLSDAVDWLKQVHLRALENRPGAESLKNTVLDILGDGLLPDGSLVRKVDSEGLWIERDGVTMPLEQVSDGYRTVAALVVDIIRRIYETYGGLEASRNESGKLVCNQPGVVLIDEVDAHLHVAWQQKIGFWLTQTFPAIQFLVTTHSPFICQAASSNGIIRLPAPGEQRTIEHIDEITWNAVVNGGADDAVMTELFGLEHAHSFESEQLRQEIAILESKLMRGTANKSEIDRYSEIKDVLSADLGELADRKLRAVLGVHE